MAKRRRSRTKRPPPGPSQLNSPPARSRPFDLERWQQGKWPVVILVTVTLAAYANAWPNVLVFDDTAFAVSDRFSGLGLADLARFFTEDLWAATGTLSGLYRPLLLLSLTVDVWLFGDWVAGYHLINIVLHAVATVFVYLLIRFLLAAGSSASRDFSGLFALLAALIYAVHPVHTEVVNSIFNRSDILVAIATVGGTWWFLRARQATPVAAWAGLCLIYLLALFCKESAVALPGIAAAMLWMTAGGNWLSRTRTCLPVLLLLIPLVIYLGLRANALSPPEDAAEPRGTIVERVEKLADPKEQGLGYGLERIAPATTMIFESMQLLVWPHPLIIHRSRLDNNIWVAAVFQLALLAFALYGLRFGRMGPFLGLAFFYIAIIPSSRIIAEHWVAPFVGERFVYVPSVGLSIFLAFELGALARRFSFRPAAVCAIAIVLVFTPLTWARNSDWASNVRLFESDHRTRPKSAKLIAGLVDAYVAEKNYDRALQICNKHFDRAVDSPNLGQQCGIAYAFTGRYGQAEAMFLSAAKDRRAAATAHLTLANLYVSLGRKDDAKFQFMRSIKREKTPFMKEFLQGFMLLQLHPHDRARLLEARSYLERSLEMQPQFFVARRELDELNVTLARMQADP